MRKTLMRLTGAALATVAMTGGATAARATGEHCGSISSGDGRHVANFTLVENPIPSARTITVFLCDRMFNCDTVFVAPRTASVGLQWRTNGDLVIRSRQGSLLSAQASSHSGTGRPPVRVLLERRALAPEPARGRELSFAARTCRTEPPVVTTVAS
jgi:hypothetical protein